MLRSLHIKNYILIDSLDIDFPEGLIIITGQTGAGKSILLGALSLLFGAKADPSMVSEGAETCVVEAEFDVRSSGHLTVRRVINASGRSRCFVNDCPVQVGVLQKMSEKLIDIHSQHKSLLLADKAFQLSVLDHFAGSREELMDCRRKWGELQQLRSSLASLRDRFEKMNADSDYNRAQYQQLESARLREGELEELEEEHKGLANAEQIMEAFAKVTSEFEAQGESKAITAALKDSSRSLERISEYMSGVGEIVARIDSLRYELEDVYSDIERMSASVSMSPERLEEVESRMSLLYSLMKKHGCHSVAELIALRDSLALELGAAGSMDEEISELEKRIAQAEKEYVEISGKLSQKRRKAAPALAASITSSLKFLELDRALFDVSVDEAQAGMNGCDRVSFLFSSTGRELMELSKVASGGEVSRIMLCLKSLMAKFVGMPTLIFDEIDTGVSGSVADKMGQMICSMGKDMQVFSITHLPQVAAKGNAHYVVSKSVNGDDKVVSSIHKVEGQERIKEIARLLSGSIISEAALANAESLLAEAAE